MDAALYQTILTTGAWADLSARAKWRLSGADRIRYLNGQVTNDVRTARADSAMHACVTNVKGKMEGEIRLHASEDTLLFDAPAELRESLGLRLEKYIIADDAMLEDVTDEWRLLHVIGSTAPEAAGHSVACSRYGLPGFDLWLPTGSGTPALPTPALLAEDMESLRILQHIPAWPSELTSDTFPPEAGLEKTAMSFTKGCYIGQEILSRIKTTGKMPRQLIAWEQPPGDTLEAGIVPGASLWAGEKEVGTLTSVTRHPDTGRLVGLGFVRQGGAQKDSVLLVGSHLPTIAPEIKISVVLNQ